MDIKKIKESIVIVTYAIILYLVLINLDLVQGTFSTLITLLTPITSGFVMAYILKEPYNFFRDDFFKLSSNDKPIIKNIKSGSALILAYTLVILILSILTILVVPQLWESIQKLATTVPHQVEIILDKTELFILNIDKLLPQTMDVDENVISELEKIWMDIVNFLTNILTTVIPAILNGIAGITSSITNMIFSFIFSIYFLSGKEKLCFQLRKILYAFLPTPIVERVLYIAEITNYSFTKFINGQVAEAFILGILCFVGMLIFQMPYAVLVSVIIGATNIIPIFGPIFGTIPATFIVLMDNPQEPMIALWFVIFILVVQRIDGDIIYPRVVGDSIGLPGVFVMLAIIVGSGLFGLAGMIIGVPLSAVIYRLIREGTYKRLVEKKITPQ
ncbi:hypothetical protein AN642_00755 [Epulopiscium sp. SCG-B10WGA-EpuloA2]|nr:hypothetical protein AN642_00755 [Epulopiscium sp. SCG-B10WGA-EpuloA2]